MRQLLAFRKKVFPVGIMWTDQEVRVACVVPKGERFTLLASAIETVPKVGSLNLSVSQALMLALQQLTVAGVPASQRFIVGISTTDVQAAATPPVRLKPSLQSCWAAWQQAKKYRSLLPLEQTYYDVCLKPVAELGVSLYALFVPCDLWQQQKSILTTMSLRAEIIEPYLFAQLRTLSLDPNYVPSDTPQASLHKSQWREGLTQYYRRRCSDPPLLHLRGTQRLSVEEQAKLVIPCGLAMHGQVMPSVCTIKEGDEL